MSTLHELNEQQTELLNRLEWLEEGDNEIELIQSHLSNLQMKAEQKIQFMAGLLAEFKAVAEVKADIAARAKKRADAANNRYENLRAFILQNMNDFDISKVEGSFGALRRQLGPRKLVFNDHFNMNDLPDFCVRLIPARMEVDKKEVLALMDSGEEVEGAMVVREPFIKFT